jgi:hypothetical protein
MEAGRKRKQSSFSGSGEVQQMKAVAIKKEGAGPREAAGHHVGFAAIRSVWLCSSTGKNSNYCGWLLFSAGSVFLRSPRPLSGTAPVLTAFGSVLLVRPEPLLHCMYAEGLPWLISLPVSSRSSGLTPSSPAVWVSSSPVTGRF